MSRLLSRADYKPLLATQAVVLFPDAPVEVCNGFDRHRFNVARAFMKASASHARVHREWEGEAESDQTRAFHRDRAALWEGRQQICADWHDVLVGGA